MRLFLVGVMFVCLAGCKDSAMDVIVQDLSKNGAEQVARQHARSYGYTDKAVLWGEIDTIERGIHRVYLREGQDKIMLRVENGKVTRVNQW